MCNEKLLNSLVENKLQELLDKNENMDNIYVFIKDNKYAVEIKKYYCKYKKIEKSNISIQDMEYKYIVSFKISTLSLRYLGGNFIINKYIKYRFGEIFISNAKKFNNLKEARANILHDKLIRYVDIRFDYQIRIL